MSFKIRGSLKLNDKKVKLTTLTNATLDFSYSSNQWIFNINNADGIILKELNAGYQMQIQLVRYQPKGTRNRLQQQSFNGYPMVGQKKGKPSYPNYIGVIDVTGDPVDADKKARINITSEQSNSFQNMNLTTWVNNMIKYESIATHGSAKIKGININAFPENYLNVGYESTGFWFSKFKFIILINNRRYAISNKELIINYYNKGNINETSISNVVQTSNSITINVGQTI
jgi:hypothetical protein